MLATSPEMLDKVKRKIDKTTDRAILPDTSEDTKYLHDQNQNLNATPNM